MDHNKLHLVAPDEKRAHILRGPDRRVKEKVQKTTVGVLVRKESLWIGAHYSSVERRWCINLVPCVTIYVVLPGGNVPRQKVKWS